MTGDCKNLKIFTSLVEKVQIISSYFRYSEYICNTNIVFHSRETWKSFYFNKKFFFCPAIAPPPVYASVQG